MVLDHIILRVNNLDESINFYTKILGFSNEGLDGPFTVLRANNELIIQLAPYGTHGFEHYAFALSKQDFIDIFDKIKENEIPYGSSFDTVGTNTGPGEENGARGSGPTVYFNDPNKHLLEIRTYD